MGVRLPWSYTSWSAWNECAFKLKCRQDKVPTGPTPEYFVRGRAVHENAAEFFHTGDGSLIASWHKNAQTAICEAAALDDRIVEHRVVLSQDWSMTNIKPGWLVIKCDVVYQSDDMTEVTIDDWKTGKTKNAAYAEELDLYRCAAAHIWAVDRYRIRLVNVDDGKITEQTCTRAEALASREKWDERATLMAVESEWLPRPNQWCRTCAYANSSGGICKFG